MIFFISLFIYFLFIFFFFYIFNHFLMRVENSVHVIELQSVCNSVKHNKY